MSYDNYIFDYGHTGFIWGIRTFIFIRMVVTSVTVNSIYLHCLLSKKEAREECIRVAGFREGLHTFHSGRLNKEFSRIMCAIKKLPSEMLHSHNPEGIPWIYARSYGGEYGGCTLDTIERLLSMGIALDIVRIVNRTGSSCDIPYTVIDDDRLIRIEKMKPKNNQRRVIIDWKR